MMAKFSVEFLRDKCKGCGLCVSVCPVHIIDIDRMSVNKKGYSPAYVTDMDKCIGCASCALICPDVVIQITRECK